MAYQCTTVWWADSLGWYAVTFGWMNVYFLNAVQHFLSSCHTDLCGQEEWPLNSQSIYKNIFIGCKAMPWKYQCCLFLVLDTWCVLFSPQLGCSVTTSSMFTFILSGHFFFFSSKLTWRGGGFFQQGSLSTYSGLVPMKGHGLMGRLHLWRLWSLKTKGVPTFYQQEVFSILLGPIYQYVILIGSLINWFVIVRHGGNEF